MADFVSPLEPFLSCRGYDPGTAASRKEGMRVSYSIGCNGIRQDLLGCAARPRTARIFRRDSLDITGPADPKLGGR
jgi:hypothetical protein